VALHSKLGLSCLLCGC